MGGWLSRFCGAWFERFNLGTPKEMTRESKTPAQSSTECEDANLTPNGSSVAASGASIHHLAQAETAARIAARECVQFRW
jgi:hypothetical protein